MLVQLGESDRLISEYDPKGEGLLKVMVTFDTLTDTYHLTHTTSFGTELMWRGSFKTVWEKYTDEVESFEGDQLIDAGQIPKRVDEILG